MPNEISTVRRSLAPTTYSEAFEFAQHLAKSSMVPSEYRGKPENILLAIQWGMEVGLAPLQAIQNIAVINGKPSVYGDALLAMVKGSAACDDVIERFEGSGDSLTAICEARRAGKAPVIARFGVADAKAAHLWGKQGPWTQYPRRMLQMRARGFALRDAFPDVLRGVITREEAADYPVDVGAPREPIDVTPRADLDRFAAQSADAAAETGETVVDDALRIAAEQTAMTGTAAFRDWWKTLDADQRNALRPEMAEYQRVAEEADRRAASEADEDPFGLPPLPSDSPAGVNPERSSADGRGGPPAGDADLLGGNGLPEDLRVPLPQPTSAQNLDYYARQLLALIAEGAPTPQRLTQIRLANERGIAALKAGAVGRYDEVMAALHRKTDAAA